MNEKEFESMLTAKAGQLQDFVHRQIPIKIGAASKAFFQNNFRMHGFLAGGLQTWEPAKRLSSGGKDAASNNPTLCSSRNHLMSSIYYIPGDASVTIGNNVPYASIHNEGGVTHPTITPAMRAHAWKEFFAAGGTSKAKREQLSPAASKWKALALTKKKSLTVNIPRRQFIGDSPELRSQIQDMINAGLKNILTK